MLNFNKNVPGKIGNSMIIKGAVVITGPAWYSIIISIFFQLFFHQTGYKIKGYVMKSQPLKRFTLKKFQAFARALSAYSQLDLLVNH
ncbi:MAG: hypothetical protein K8S18_05800, partial [Desulfobacula sp.]|nr:hypothetical protein [Desulfobacula sp.]